MCDYGIRDICFKRFQSLYTEKNMWHVMSQNQQYRYMMWNDLRIYSRSIIVLDLYQWWFITMIY